MSKLSKLRRKVRRLKRENLNLIIEVNAARVRAGEAHEALEDWGRSIKIERANLSDWDWTEVPLDG